MFELSLGWIKSYFHQHFFFCVCVWLYKTIDGTGARKIAKKSVECNSSLMKRWSEILNLFSHDSRVCTSPGSEAMFIVVVVVVLDLQYNAYIIHVNMVLIKCARLLYPSHATIIARNPNQGNIVKFLQTPSSLKWNIYILNQ